jgi:outer membrane protein assembly factor BamB
MASAYAWPAFDGGGARSGVNTFETVLTPGNVGGLHRLWQVALPAVVDSAPAAFPNVATAGGVKDLLFLTTKTGSLLAVDQANGAIVWQRTTSGASSLTTSSPAIDPSGQYVYGYGLDGKVHKYAIGTGNEVADSTWPAVITLMPAVEKGSAAINIANGYLYMTTSGYFGDGGHYEGHVVAVGLTTGAKTVFNSLCADIPQLLNANPSSPNYCADVQSGIWGRAGAVVDLVTGNVFVATGNGNYTANVGGHDYGDSVIELSPDLTRVIDTYTPASYATLQANDQDLGSAAPALLPPQAGSATPSLALQGGKDGVLRLLDRQNLSGQHEPGHVGGELQVVSGIAGDVVAHPAAWTDANGATWVFVTDNLRNLYAYRVVTNGGPTSLQLAYSSANGGSSPLLVNGMLIVQGNNVLQALNPATGAILWSSTQTAAGGSTGPLHWQSPVVVNGHVFTADDAGNLTAYGL